MITEFNGRTYQLKEETALFPNLRAEIVRKGFDGTIWYGEAKPVDRQRKTFRGMFLRTPDGQFTSWSQCASFWLAQ